jgi:polyribonucleotide nucleotidyltransferase
LSDICVSYQNGQYLLNLIAIQLKVLELDLILYDIKTAILMVESEAKKL